MRRVFNPERYEAFVALLDAQDAPDLLGPTGRPRGSVLSFPGDPKRRWTVMLGLMTKWLQHRCLEVDRPAYIGQARAAR